MPIRHELIGPIRSRNLAALLRKKAANQACVRSKRRITILFSLRSGLLLSNYFLMALWSSVKMALSQM